MNGVWFTWHTKRLLVDFSSNRYACTDLDGARIEPFDSVRIVDGQTARAESGGMIEPLSLGIPVLIFAFRVRYLFYLPRGSKEGYEYDRFTGVATRYQGREIPSFLRSHEHCWKSIPASGRLRHCA
jgi:hypothetical protein